MKSKLQLIAAAWIFISSVALISCQKESSLNSPAVSEEEAITAAQENTAADAAYDDVAEIGLSAGADLEATTSDNGTATESVSGGLDFRPNLFENLQFKIGPCTKIEVSPNDSTFPKTIIVNYGEGCFCRDGKFRKGAIVLHFTGPIRRAGSILTITFRDYFVNRVHIQGTKTIENLSAEGVHKYATHVEDGKVTWPNGRGFTYHGSKEVTQVRGMDTRTIRDDVYSIEGRNKTVYANGTTVIKNTETPLIKPVACEWIVKGILKVKINDRVLFIDFGNGDCDNKATLKWAGGEKEITLP